MRSDDILPLAEARFDVVHKATSGALFPLTFGIELATREREVPDLLARLRAAEDEVARDPAMRPCVVYAVFPKRT